jgi:hypothetical protein
MKLTNTYVKINKWLFAFILLAMLSCSKDDESVDQKSKTQENFVSLSLAKEIASDISFKPQISSLSSKTSSTGISKKTIESVNEIKNNSGKIVFYVINYIEGGYVILSADNRARPIIGFSEDSKFVLDKGTDTSYPSALKSWVEDAKKQISIIQNSTAVQTEDEKLAWRQVKNILDSNKKGVSAKSAPVDECYEHTVTEIKGPYLQSTWDQLNGYNYSLPYITCGGSFQIYAGCVPIAMAQVMKYYGYPTTYNWSSMPVNYATSTTANFLLDIHNAIRSVYPGEPQYSCSGTGVSSNKDMGQVLKSKFYYTTADWGNYNYQVVRSNLAAGRPVILSGSGNSGGHMWVCDGYMDTDYYYADCTGIGTLYYHMNWGWNGSNNGYFAFNNFTVAGMGFNNNTKMIYNIKP